MTRRRAGVAAVAVALTIAAGVAAGVSSDTGCTTVTPRVIVVDLDNGRHAHVLDHAWDAIRAGEPEVLTLDRAGARENRRESLRGIPTRRGFDRDEYAPAVSLEGGAGADVRYVRSGENRSAGSVMRAQLAGFCEGTRFRFERPKENP